MSEAIDEHEANRRREVMRDKDLVWELYGAQPDNPRVGQLAHSLLEREPSFTGTMILLSLHHQARGDIEAGRRWLHELLRLRDRQYVNALRELRDLEYGAANFAEAERLALQVMKEADLPSWQDEMDLGLNTALASSADRGWQIMSQAVLRCAKQEPDEYAAAQSLYAVKLLISVAPIEMFLPAAEAAIQSDPSNLILACTLGYAYLYDLRLDDAERLLVTALRQDPTDEICLAGMHIVKSIRRALADSDYDHDFFMDFGMGEMIWRTMRHQLMDTHIDIALAALNPVLPADLATSLLPPGHGEDLDELQLWHDGQAPETAGRWGTEHPWRLMTSAEIEATEKSITDNPDDWPGWTQENYADIAFTDDDGSYLISGKGGRIWHRSPAGDDREVSLSWTDWVWDRVADFGGRDQRLCRR